MKRYNGVKLEDGELHVLKAGEELYRVHYGSNGMKQGQQGDLFPYSPYNHRSMPYVYGKKTKFKPKDGRFDLVLDRDDLCPEARDQLSCSLYAGATPEAAFAESITRSVDHLEAGAPLSRRLVQDTWLVRMIVKEDIPMIRICPMKGNKKIGLVLDFAHGSCDDYDKTRLDATKMMLVHQNSNGILYTSKNGGGECYFIIGRRHAGDHILPRIEVDENWSLDDESGWGRAQLDSYLKQDGYWIGSDGPEY